MRCYGGNHNRTADAESNARRSSPTGQLPRGGRYGHMGNRDRRKRGTADNRGTTLGNAAAEPYRPANAGEVDLDTASAVLLHRPSTTEGHTMNHAHTVFCNQPRYIVVPAANASTWGDLMDYARQRYCVWGNDFMGARQYTATSGALVFKLV